MATYADHVARRVAKILVVGDSGAGKTAAIATLANAGYNVRILDFDNGLDILQPYLTEEGLKHVHYVTLREEFGKKPTAWTRALAILNNWKTETEDFGSVTTWTEKDVLVIDTLSFMSKACLAYSLDRHNKKVTDKPGFDEWYDVVRDMEYVIAWLTSDLVKCHLVCNAHIAYREDPSGATKGFPSTVGNRLGTAIGPYFNNVIRLDVQIGAGGKESVRKFRTVSDYKMALKNAKPKDIPAEMEVDLAKFIKTIVN